MSYKAVWNAVKLQFQQVNVVTFYCFLTPFQPFHVDIFLIHVLEWLLITIDNFAGEILYARV
jgi:hypothetical protein